MDEAEHIQKLEMLLAKIQSLNEIGIALTLEKHPKTLLEKISLAAKNLTHADGSTIYTVTPDHHKLHFETIFSDSISNRDKDSSLFQDIPLFDQKGRPDEEHIVTYAVHHKKTISVEDAYNSSEFDFSGTRRFDEKTGYHTQSVLTVPLINHEGDVVGVLQLINALDPQKNVIAFSKEDQHLAESLASQAAISLSNQQLIHELNQLFESFIQSIANAIDAKSPSTANHSKRVPLIVSMFAEAINETKTHPFQDIHFSEEEMYELKVASLLHDCGKITTPEYLIHKEKKLEGLFDRMASVEARFEILKRDALLSLIQKKMLSFKEKDPALFERVEKECESASSEYTKKIDQLQKDQQFLIRCNEGKETRALLAKIKEIGSQTYKIQDKIKSLLTEDEIECLSVEQGNLTIKEKEVVKNHVVMTLKILEELYYPKFLKNVPNIAGAHHERIDGKGYPYGLKGEEISIGAKILAIADVFEALSAPDRSYRTPLSLSEIIVLMQRMCDEGQLDPELFKLFVDTQIPQNYGIRYLTPSQLDI